MRHLDRNAVPRQGRGRRPRRCRTALYGLVLALCALTITGTGAPGSLAAPLAQDTPATPRPLPLGRIEGLVNGGTVRYVERLLDDAERQASEAAVIMLDVTGGYEGATRRVVRRIEGSGIPVIVFVAPAGARAAAAGLYVAQAADVVAMAPGTAIAGRPPGFAGEAAAQTPPSAVAWAAALTQARGRNAAWAEGAMRDGASLTASDALRLRAVDEVAGDVDDLLSKLDGRRVTGPWGTRPLATRGLTATPVPMAPWERWLNLIIDPNVAYLLFVIGLYGVIAEIAAPGVTVPGLIGFASLALALYAFSNLPVAWSGAGIMVVAAALLLAETQVASHGLLALGGVVTFVAGSIFLFRPTAGAPFGAPATLNPWLIALLGIGSAALFGWLVKQGLATLRQPQVNDLPGAGEVGIAGQVVDARGTVHLRGQTWSAEWPPGTVQPGERVRVVGRRGLRLLVEPLPEGPPGPPGPPASSG